jgi:phosphohistidine phosphatase
MASSHDTGTERLYLVQHGEAKPESEDPKRPLTDAGRESVARVADWAVRVGLVVDQIHHSGKRRARQTAEILAEKLRSPQGLAEVAGMKPNDDVRPIIDMLDQYPRSIMLVGHLPFLSRMADMLLLGQSGHDVVRFQYGAIVGMARQDDRWQLTTVIPPELCR